MHFPSNQRRRHGRPWRASTVALVALLAGLAGVAHAVDFDLNVKAPALKVGPALKKSAESYSTTFARLSKASPVEMVTNKALFLEHFEIAWQLQRALDDHLPMEDLSAIGLVKREDGAIEIDLKAFPQWDSFTDRLMAMMPAMNYDLAGPQLINRGFRDSDIAAIRNYLSTHDLRTAAAAKTLPIAIGFSRLVKKYDKLKLPVRNDLVYSFIYQRAKAEALARREWAESLLQVLDAQRIRVLHSYFDEMPGFSVWAPSDTVAGIGGVLTQMRLPDYEDRVTAEARGVTP